MKLKLWNGKTVEVKDTHSQGDDFYLCYDLKDQAIDQCRDCGKYAYRADLDGSIDDWTCPAHTARLVNQ